MNSPLRAESMDILSFPVTVVKVEKGAADYTIRRCESTVTSRPPTDNCSRAWTLPFEEFASVRYQLLAQCARHGLLPFAVGWCQRAIQDDMNQLSKAASSFVRTFNENSGNYTAWAFKFLPQLPPKTADP